MLSLWNIIRDFFVEYIFGGNTSDGRQIMNTFGSIETYLDGGYDDGFVGETTGIFVTLNDFSISGDNYLLRISFSDWLSTTATIIVLTLICVAIGMAVVWLFKEVYRMITKWAL